MKNSKYEIRLEWTNQEEFHEHVEKLKKQYGDHIPAEAAFDFAFEFNHGLGRTCKD